MISAEVIKGVQQLLIEHGERQKPGERFGDFVARSLAVSAGQAEALLKSLHDGETIDAAVRAADIGPAAIDRSLLTQVARVIGATLGRVAR